jgi:hypothetical protein
LPSDGKTSSKDGWEGDLGKLLPKVRGLDRILQFPAVKGKTTMPELSETVVGDLSTDQSYGYRCISGDSFVGILRCPGSSRLCGRGRWTQSWPA